jgi:hypothetical protein
MLQAMTEEERLEFTADVTGNMLRLGKEVIDKALATKYITKKNLLRNELEKRIREMRPN